ncbi:MAG: adenylate/guanylate cyclase domain-containing protein [Alphaproteobacteria bacterium]|nr:adenylate/guanylate cyclase domain-containing protein [Alphaproteobacteria bacterium]
MSNPATADPADIIDWLLSGEARRLPKGPAVLKALCLRLTAAGLPLARASFHVRTLHPQLFGVGYFWYRGRDDIEVFQAKHGVRDQEIYKQSPIRLIFEGLSDVRQSLELPDEAFELSRYAEIKAQGMTEYMLLPLTFSDGKIHATTWSTDRPGGFADAEVALIKAILPAFSLLIEIHLNRRIAINLLDTYVGHQAGEHILSGQITRGSGESIPAAIWFSDLRGFTAMSESRSRDELLDLLNQFFDCLAAPVTERGGEILKFIGDAMLAIFPLADEDACAKALEAAIEAQASLEALNAERERNGETAIACGIALHAGEVMYGNIGSQSRLDFTVIGPAVNLASRIEGLCPDLGADILLSQAFADRLGGGVPLESLGGHRLKGVEDEVLVFRPSTGATA